MNVEEDEEEEEGKEEEEEGELVIAPLCPMVQCHCICFGVKYAYVVLKKYQ